MNKSRKTSELVEQLLDHPDVADLIAEAVGIYRKYQAPGEDQDNAAEHVAEGLLDGVDSRRFGVDIDEAELKRELEEGVREKLRKTPKRK